MHSTGQAQTIADKKDRLQFYGDANDKKEASLFFVIRDSARFTGQQAIFESLIKEIPGPDRENIAFISRFLPWETLESNADYNQVATGQACKSCQIICASGDYVKV